MTALRALDNTPSIQSHQPDRPLIENFIELDAWLDGRIRHFWVDLDDDETAQSIGERGRTRAAARIAAFTEVREQIESLVQAERAERAAVSAETSVEQQYKERYGPDADKLAAWQAEGR